MIELECYRCGATRFWVDMLWDDANYCKQCYENYVSKDGSWYSSFMNSFVDEEENENE